MSKYGIMKTSEMQMKCFEQHKEIFGGGEGGGRKRIFFSRTAKLRGLFQCRMEPETLKPFINRIPALSTLLPLRAADAAFWTKTAMFPSCCSCYGIDLRGKINTGNSVGGRGREDGT